MTTTMMMLTIQLNQFTSFLSNFLFRRFRSNISRFKRALLCRPHFHSARDVS